MEQHNDSKWGAHYTKIRRPVVLKYSEKYKTLIEARRREKEIKGWVRRKKVALIHSFNPEWKELSADWMPPSPDTLRCAQGDKKISG